MKAKLFFITCLIVSGCGRSGDNNIETEVLTCTIVENTLMCPDGTEYPLPDVEATPEVSPVPEGPVVTEPSEEEDPESACARHNRYKNKCRKIKHGRNNV